MHFLNIIFVVLSIYAAKKGKGDKKGDKGKAKKEGGEEKEEAE